MYDEYIPDAYLPGHLIPGYSNYCPITPVNAFKNSETGIVTISHQNLATETEVQPQDLLLGPGFLVLQLGEIEEDYTLSGAVSSLVENLDHLFSACNVPVTLERIRTKLELKLFMRANGDIYSHIIFVGHGSEDGLHFLDDPSPVGSVELAALLGLDSRHSPATVISLCCHSGCESLGSALSSAVGARVVVAPDGATDVRWATVFVVGLLLKRFAEGLPIAKALAAINEFCTPLPMVAWRDGELLDAG